MRGVLNVSIVSFQIGMQAGVCAASKRPFHISPEITELPNNHVMVNDDTLYKSISGKGHCELSSLPPPPNKTTQQNQHHTNL